MRWVVAYLNNRIYTERYAACILWLAESTGLVYVGCRTN